MTEWQMVSESIFGWPFVQRFALRYRTVVCPVCNVGVLWPNGWMDQDAAWYGGRLRPSWHCVRWGPSYPYGKGHSNPKYGSGFTGADRAACVRKLRPMSIVAKQSPISATAELLYIDVFIALLKHSRSFKNI